MMNMNNKESLKGKNILLFSQYFFGYEEKIRNKMIELGATVDMYDERAVTTAIGRAILKVMPAIYRKKTEQYYDSIFKEVRGRNYHYILFIDCEMASIKVLQRFKCHFKHAKMCLHMWDSVKNLNHIDRKFHLFDIITTFDRRDAQDFSLTFRPLFFDDDYCQINSQVLTKKKYQLSFIGTIHSDRYRIIKKIREQFSDEEMYVYPYLQSKFVYWLYRLTKKEFYQSYKQDFKYEKLSSREIAEIVSSSKCVLDIHHPNQSGLTMRTLEMIGMKMKIITTNADIRNYDFFHPNNIMVIDREHPVVEKDFFALNYIDIAPDIYNYYHITNWIFGVLGIYG